MALGLVETDIDTPKREEQDMPVTKESVITFVENEYTRRMKERRPFELQWRLNMCFLEGQQHVEINPVGMNLEEMPKAYWYQEREVFNHIAPLYETRLARLTRMRPILKTRPGSDDQEDVRAAKVGSILLKNIYYDHGVQSKVHEAASWLEATGTVFGKNIWNPDKGPVIGHEPIPDVYGNVEAEGQGDGFYQHMQQQIKEIREGDLEVLICPCFEILPDSSYRSGIKETRSIIHAKTYHVDDIKEIWGVDVTAESSSAIRLHMAPIGNGGLGYGRGDFQFASVNLDSHAVLKEYWERPTKKYPQGRLIIVAGKKLLYHNALPFPVDEDDRYGLPFERCASIERPGLFWGKCFIDRVIPLQRRYNAIKNRKAEFINKATIGGWLVEKNSVNLDDFEAGASAPGYMAVYKKGSKAPQPMQTGNYPTDFDKEEQNLLSEFNIFSAVSDLTKQSKAPPGVKSGVALSLALEQDDTRLALVAGNIEQFLVNMGKQWLRLYKHYVTFERTQREIGDNNVIELIDWTGADIKSEDVVVEAFSAMADSPAQRRQMIFDLMGAGLLVDPETGTISKEMRNKIFEMIELGNWESGNSMDELHTAKADRENLSVIEGGQPTPAPYDDHILHIDAHNKFRLTTDYEQMMKQNPMIEQIFQQHVDIHLMHIAPPEVQQELQQMQSGQRPGQAETQAAPPPEGVPMDEPETQAMAQPSPFEAEGEPMPDDMEGVW